MPSTADRTVLRVDGITVAYGKLPALRDVQLEVAEGELVAVVGPNGAGKSTLLLAIAGGVAVRSGEISFCGASVRGRSPERNARDGIALVPEGRHIFQTMSVADNLRVGATVIRDRMADETLERIFALFPVLERYYRSNAGKLSGGEQQQLAIARALVGRPRLLLLDEPSLGLAPAIIERVFAALLELQRTGMTILLVEQFAARAVALADRSYVLHHGAIALSGTREELAQRQDVDSAFFGGVDGSAS
jgi:branched-chain amino acid transport system ATP-binding protein